MVRQKDQTPGRQQQCPRTRIVCIFGTVLGLLFSLGCLISGSIMINCEHIIPEYMWDKALRFNHWRASPSYPANALTSTFHRYHILPKGTSALVGLLLTFVVTIILDTTSYVHSVTLKWALFHEDRLEFNSNIRLFTCSDSHGPNTWYMNAISLLGLTITYGASSSVLFDIYIIGTWDPGLHAVKYDWNYDQTVDIIDINLQAVIALGIGLMLQVGVSIYSLVWSTSKVKTWEGDFLANGKAWLEAVEASPSGPPKATKRYEFISQQEQPSMIEVIPQVRLVRRITWGFCALFTLWSLIQGIVDRAYGYDLNGMVQGSSKLDIYWAFWGTQSTDFMLKFSGHASGWLPGLILQMVGQSFITFALHCVELLFIVSRDEAVWRKAETVGLELNPSIISNVSWEAVLLLILKSVIQFVFGYAFSADVTINFALLPVISLMILFFILTIICEYIVRKKPRGSLPAVYGRLDLLVAIVDEWSHDRIFWGDKGFTPDGKRRAGMSGQKLEKLQPSTMYCCERSSDGLNI